MGCLKHNVGWDVGLYGALRVFVWGSMGSGGSLWGAAVCPYGVLWVSMGLCGVLWFPVGLYGSLWVLMGCCRDLWGTVDLWGAVDLYGVL